MRARRRTTHAFGALCGCSRYPGVIVAAFAVALIGADVARAAAPANDNFSAATPISGTQVDLDAQSNVGATLEPLEPTMIAGQPAAASVWYVWTPSASANAVVSTCHLVGGSGTTFDTLLAVYTGSAVSALTVVGSNDDATIGCTGTASAVPFTAQAGTTYHIAVDGKSLATGNFELHLSQYVNGGGGDQPEPADQGTGGPQPTIDKLLVNSKKRTAKVTFSAPGRGLTFECELDNHPFSACTSPKTYRHLRVGKHKVEVRAKTRTGVVSSPAVRKFKIRP